MARNRLNQDNLLIKKQFIIQLREEYHKKHTPLWDCFLMYLGFLSALGCEYLAEYTPLQLKHYKAAIENTKCMWHRNRRAGKTIGLSNLAVFYSIIQFGYRANAGKVVWRAPANDQLSQAQEWLTQNPFVEHINQENDVSVLNSKPIDMACLSAGKAASKGASVIIEDEYRDVPKGYKVYDIAGRAEDMVAEGPNATRRMISASTGCRLTFFHDQFLSGEWVYCRQTYHDCPWITEEYVESKRKEHPEDPYFVQQEFESVWVARGDTAYRNVYIIDTVAKTITHNENVYKFGDHPFFPLEWKFPEPRKAGCDFNDSAGHYVVIGSDDAEAIYMNKEFVITTIAELMPFSEQYNLEIESGPFKINIENAYKCTQLGMNCVHQDWDEETKAERFRETMDKMLIIDRRGCPFTLGNYESGVFDPNARESKLKKDSQQHGLDASWHMIHKTNYLITKEKYLTNLDPNYRSCDEFGTIS